ncbi:hypothetical protein HDU81_006183 [Chytriomyces hyalinus]|nr:hypothetical protein HDU81_006183 [Chytriomyces hyalinus]
MKHGNLHLLKASQLAESGKSTGSEITAYAAVAFLSDTQLPVPALNALGPRLQRVAGHATDATTSPDKLDVCCGIIFTAGMYTCWRQYDEAIEAITQVPSPASSEKS